TQARSALLAHNADNLRNVAGSTAVDPSFTIKVPIAPGPNGITLKATDPAGNSTSVVVSVRRGNGKLTVSLTPSAYRVKVTTAHSGFTLTAVVTDPDGHPLENVSVTFTLSGPGGQPITGTADTDGTGSATFRTAIPKTQLPHTPYTAPATALATSDAFGSAQTQVPITYYRGRGLGCQTAATGPTGAATIGPCRCGGALTAGRPRQRPRGAGCAIAPARAAGPAETSDPLSRTVSVTAAWTARAGRSLGMSSWPAGRTHRARLAMANRRSISSARDSALAGS